MSNKYNRVASMGTDSSKYGTQRSEIEKGDTVSVNDGQYTGTVVRVSRREIIVNVDGTFKAFNPEYVELA